MQFERSDKDIGGRVLKGAGFLVLGRLIVRGLSIVNIAVLGRLLDAEDFGLAALAMTAVGLMTGFTDLKIGGAIVALDKIDRRHIDTGFTIQAIRGLIIAALMFIFAPQVAIFMEAPELEAVLRVLAVALVLEGFGNPAFILYARNVDFSKEFNRQAVASLAGGIVLIASAFYFRNYWAIVAGTLAQYLFTLISTYWHIDYRPRLSLSTWRDYLGFSGWMSLQSMLGRLQGDAANLMIGKMLGPTMLGFYTIARDGAVLTLNEMITPLTRTLTPGFGAIKNDRERLGRTYTTTLEVLGGIIFPLAAGLAILAPEFISILVGPKWLSSAPLMQVLLLGVAFRILAGPARSITVALGEVRALFVRTLVSTTFLWLFIYIGIRSDGLIGAVYGHAAGGGVILLLNVMMVRFYASVGIRRQLFASWRSMIAAGVMAAAVIAARPPFDPGASLLEIGGRSLWLAALGAATYVAVHTLVWRLSGRPEGFETNLMHYGGRAFGALKLRLAR